MIDLIIDLKDDMIDWLIFKILKCKCTTTLNNPSGLRTY